MSVYLVQNLIEGERHVIDCTHCWVPNRRFVPVIKHVASTEFEDGVVRGKSEAYLGIHRTESRHHALAKRRFP